MLVEVGGVVLSSGLLQDHGTRRGSDRRRPAGAAALCRSAPVAALCAGLGGGQPALRVAAAAALPPLPPADWLYTPGRVLPVPGTSCGWVFDCGGGVDYQTATENARWNDGAFFLTGLGVAKHCVMAVNCWSACYCLIRGCSVFFLFCVLSFCMLWCILDMVWATLFAWI